MFISKAGEIRSSEITPKDTYLNRRNFLTCAALTGAAAAAGIVFQELADPQMAAQANAKIEGLQVVTADERFAPYGVQLVPADE